MIIGLAFPKCYPPCELIELVAGRKENIVLSYYVLPLSLGDFELVELVWKVSVFFYLNYGFKLIDFY